MAQSPLFRRVALSIIVLLAAALRLYDLQALGYVNHYYTAGITSMLQSWHNLFFVAAEPGGAVSIDKPPVGLWLQAASAFIFGVNTFGVLLPQLLAGIVSVVLVYHLARRSFGTLAGLVAALALAITPVTIAVDRNNTIDSTLILALLLAAWAFIKATETTRWRWLLLGAGLIGVAFNIKMLEAFLPLPAFYALYALGARERWWHKVGKLAAASVVVLVVSLSWAVAVDLTPASQHPYVGSSGSNSVVQLMLGYNGIQRLTGMGGNGGMGGGSQGGFQRGGQNRGSQPPQNNAGQPQKGSNKSGNGGGLAGFNTGQAGALRLFTTPLGNQISWLLPVGLFGALLLLFHTRPRWPIATEHQALVVWGGWLLTGGVFFSIAGYFHPYYLAILAPALAILVGISAALLWRMRATRQWLATGLLLAASAGTLALQFVNARAYTANIWWMPIAAALLLAGTTLLILAGQRRKRSAIAGFACVLLALFLTPGIWSALTTANTNPNQSLPTAYDGQNTNVAQSSGLTIDQNLLALLERNTQSAKYLLAVPSSMQGADYVIATGRPVLYLGGFIGQDNVASSAQLAQMVADGQLRYIYWNSISSTGNRFGGGNNDITTWVQSSCSVVNGFDATTQNSGAPGGIEANTTNNSNGGMGRLQVSLYDCGG